MSLVRFEPWSLVDLLQRDFDRLAGRPLRHIDGDTTVADWMSDGPAADSGAPLLIILHGLKRTDSYCALICLASNVTLSKSAWTTASC